MCEVEMTGAGRANVDKDLKTKSSTLGAVMGEGRQLINTPPSSTTLGPPVRLAG